MRTAADEHMHTSLRTLHEAMRVALEEMTTVARHFQAMDELRSQGHSWPGVLDAIGDAQDVPHINRLVSDIVAASAQLTRATVAALLDGGVPQHRLAKVLGVSHQRTSQIVKALPRDTVSDTAREPSPSL